MEEQVSTLTNSATTEPRHPQSGADRPAYPLYGPRPSLSSVERSVRIDHRRCSRHRVLTLVKVYHSDNRCTAGLLYDLSADGMLVLSEDQPGVSRRVDVEFPLSPAWGMAITIKGIVVHCRKSGFGLMFREPDDPALTMLGECLRSIDAIGPAGDGNMSASIALAATNITD